MGVLVLGITRGSKHIWVGGHREAVLLRLMGMGGDGCLGLGEPIFEGGDGDGGDGFWSSWEEVWPSPLPPLRYKKLNESLLGSIHPLSSINPHSELDHSTMVSSINSLDDATR